MNNTNRCEIDVSNEIHQTITTDRLLELIGSNAIAKDIQYLCKRELRVRLGLTGVKRAADANYETSGIIQLQEQLREAMNAFMQVHKHLTEVCRLADESCDAFDADLEGFMDAIRKEAFEGMKVEVNSIKKEMKNA